VNGLISNKLYQLRITYFFILMERGVQGFSGMFTTAGGIAGKNVD